MKLSFIKRIIPSVKSVSVWRRGETDILIFDSIGADLLQDCIPNNLCARVFDSRQTLPWISDIRFLLSVTAAFISNRTHNQTLAPMTHVLIRVFLEQLQPRLILSFADNSYFLSQYALDHPEIPIVLVQNALRDESGSIKRGQDLPIYLSLGVVEQDLFKALSINCRRYIPVGSLKLGLALKNFDSDSHHSVDLSFISHYRSSMLDTMTNIHSLDAMIEQNQRELFGICCHYAFNNWLTLQVLAKSRNPLDREREEAYFLEIVRDLNVQIKVNFVHSDKSERQYNSYFGGLSSDLIIHQFSTLGFELLASGKKVVVGATLNPKLISEWGVSKYIASFPQLLKLPSAEGPELFAQLDKIRAMPNSDYQALALSAGRTVVSTSNTVSPQEEITEILKNIVGSKFPNAS